MKTKEPLAPMDAQAAVDTLKKHFLGDEWLVVGCNSKYEENAVVVHRILALYADPEWPEKWREMGETT